MITLNSILHYIVFVGRTCGIKKNYEETITQIKDYPGGFYEVYVCREDAIAAIERFTGMPYYDEPDIYNELYDND